MKKDNKFIVQKTRNGIYVKRFYTYEKAHGGKIYRKFYYAKRMNIAEVASYKLQNLSNGIIKNRKKIAMASVTTLLALCLVFVMTLTNNFDKKDGDFKKTDKTTAVDKGNTKLPQGLDIEYPNVDTYESSNGKTFLTLDSALEISRYNYYNLVEELQAYNKNCQKGQEYNFDSSMFDLNTFVGLQIRESSLQLNDKNDGHYKGGFKIGDDAAKEANEVAINLTGKPIFETEADRENPVKASKACMYISVKNYEYLHDHINKLNSENNTHLKVTPEMVIDTYLMGCGNMMKELRTIKSSDEYSKKYYSIDINAYANILEPYSTALFEEGLIEEEHDDERKATYAKLNGVVSVKNQKAQDSEK